MYLAVVLSCLALRPAVGNLLEPMSQVYERLSGLDQLRGEAEKLQRNPLYVANWPKTRIAAEQVSGISISQEGLIVIFHRGSRVWDATTFYPNNTFAKASDGPINVDTVAYLQPEAGNVVSSWGKDMFYIPHGITVDKSDNVWLTDVALHQVFKFDKNGKLLLTLGKSFVHGQTNDLFCKPTSVAVLQNGDFFVADGYCNNRIMKFYSSGQFILEWGRNSLYMKSPKEQPPYSLFIPHSLSMSDNEELLYVADRENGRVQVYNTVNGTYRATYSSPLIGGEIFAVAVQGKRVFVVNGQDITNRTVRGFVFENDTLTSYFSPSDGDLNEPHDLAVSHNGKDIYVAQIRNPTVVKFTYKTANSNTGPATARVSTSDIPDANAQSVSSIARTSSILILAAIAGLCAGLMLFKMRKRGLFGSRVRHQPFEFKPTSVDGFKLSNFLDRNKRPGFEKLNTEESDEENGRLSQCA